MNNNKENVQEAEDLKVYEVGYHIIPKISEGDVPAEVEKVKTILLSHGASVIAEEMPRMTQLSYEMAKATSGKREMFDRAYFGWIKFEVAPSEVLAIKEEVETYTNILRSILVETVRESTLSKKVFVSEHLQGEIIRKPEMAKEGDKKLTDAEIDSAVDELVSGASTETPVEETKAAEGAVEVKE